jgi:hypothetical protein
MRLRIRIAVVLALGGFAGCILGAAAWASMACCATHCEACPMLLSKSALPGSVQKVDHLPVILPAVFRTSSLTGELIRFAAIAQPHVVRSPAFQRPMRN